MGLFAGIIGLPNVGKSTLFNTITNSSVEAANYPFATIEPNVGVVNVPDTRLLQLSALINPDKTTPAICKFVDIAGLVKGASQGEGLGNQFLNNIREADAICHVVRCFNDKDIIHVYDQVDPIRDVEIINIELALSDLEIVNKRISKINNKAKSGDKTSQDELKLFEAIKANLEKGQLTPLNTFSKENHKLLSSYNLLTLKPILYVANVNEDDIVNPQKNEHYLKLKAFADETKANVIPLSIRIEHEISVLEDEDKISFMKDLNIEKSGLDYLIQETYKMLNLSTFFTFGKSEVKAWTFVQGMSAPQCAGIIHSDFERGFIKAEVMFWEDLAKYKTETSVKEKGRMHLEGKDYIMKDGDVCYFKFNV